MNKFMGDKNLLTPADEAQAFYDRVQVVAQDLMNHVEKKYMATDAASVVSLAALTISITLARECSNGVCTKEMFMQKASEVWDTMIAVKKS